MTQNIPKKSIALLNEEYADLGAAIAELHCENVTVIFHEKDTAPLARKLNVIVPISFRTVTVGEENVIHCAVYPELCDVAFDFFEEWYDAPFSENALSELYFGLFSHLKKWNYVGWSSFDRFGVARLLSENGVSDIQTRAGVRMLTDKDATRTSLLMMNLSDSIKRGAAGYITERGEVAALASVNGALGTHRFAEIGVECAPLYRRQGIATEVTACLCQHLQNKGETPLYCHYHNNTASAALAAHVGFVPAGAFYSYQAWRKFV